MFRTLDSIIQGHAGMDDRFVPSTKAEHKRKP